MTRLLLALLTLLFCSTAFGQSQELTRLLRALERGDVDAVSRLERGHPLQAIEPLGRALSQRDPQMRRAAASALWTLAETESYHQRIESEAGAALQGALSDPDAMVAMSAAGSLQLVGRAPDTMVDARRRVLHSDASVLPRFLAARGLIGFEPGASLAPPLVDFLRASAPAQNIGLTSSVGATDNLKLAHSAIERLLESDAAGAIEALLPELVRADPAVPSLLVLLDTQRAAIPDWVDHLVRQVDSPNPQTQERAWELLGELDDPVQAARWVAMAAARLPTSPFAMVMLNSLRDQAGASPDAFPALATHALDTSRPEAERRRAIEAIEVATNENQTHADAASRAAAREHGLRVAAVVLTDATAPDDAVDAARYAMRNLEPDETRRATWLTDVLLGVTQSRHQVELLVMLGQIGDQARPNLERLRPFVDSPEEAVRTAAVSSLDSIDPAWRARETRASRPLAALQQASAPTPKPAPMQVEQDSRPTPKSRGRASFPDFYETIRAGNLAAFRAQLDAGLPINTAQKIAPIVEFQITPLQAVVDYCHVTTLVDSETLLKMAALLLERGADPGLKGSRDRSALETAFDSQCPEPLRLLLQGG